MNRELQPSVRASTPMRWSDLGVRSWPIAAVRWFAERNARHLIIALLIGIAFGGYFTMRYGGAWAEHDSRFFVGATDSMLANGTIVYPDSYPHGYTFPAWMAMLSLLTGLAPGELSRFYTPVIGSMLVALMSYTAFRRFLGSRRLGLLATTTIFLVPELVFTAARGNHEKLSISLTLLTSLAILRSFSELRRQKPRWTVYAGWTLLFYLVIFALISVNFIFGMAVLAAWTVTLFLVGALTLGRTEQTRAQLRLAFRRMRPLIWSSWILAFLIAWYVYPPMKTDIAHIKGSVTSILEFFSNETAEGSEPYGTIEQQWVDPRVYNALTLFRWVLFAGSGVGALVLGVRTVWRPTQVRIERVILLGLFFTFGLELAGSVAADFSGLGFGDNLQVRFFTYFGLFAAPLFVITADWVLIRLRRWAPRPPFRAALTALFVYFAISSLLKATLDPLVSNNWIFFHPNEIAAMETWSEHVERRTLYIGSEIRLWPAWIMTNQTGMPNDNFVDSGSYDPRTSHAFSSRIKRLQASATSLPLSPLLEQNRVYDNGEAQIYHRIPQTPLQQ